MSRIPEKPVYRPATWEELEDIEDLMDTFPRDQRPPNVQSHLRECLGQQALMCEAAMLPMVKRLVEKL